MLGRVIQALTMPIAMSSFTASTPGSAAPPDPSVLAHPSSAKREPSPVLAIIGVMPEGMEQLGSTVDYYTPTMPGNRVQAASKSGRSSAGCVTACRWRRRRRKPTRRQRLAAAAVASAPPLTGPRIHAELLKDSVVGSLKPALRVLLTAVAVLLLIVCANVANLLLARGSARQREIAVRLAIGASRGRIVRQILAECAVLSLVGGVLGAAVGAAGVALVKSLATVQSDGIFRLVFGQTILPRANEVAADWRVLAIALTLAAVTSIVFGVLPALHLSRTNHLQAMGSRGAGRSRREARTRMSLVVGQLVMATVLLVGAGLLAHSFLKLSQVDKGYDAARALAFQLVLPPEYSSARKTETIECCWRGCATHQHQAAGLHTPASCLASKAVGTWVPPGRTRGGYSHDLSKPR